MSSEIEERKRLRLAKETLDAIVSGYKDPDSIGEGFVQFMTMGYALLCLRESPGQIRDAIMEDAGMDRVKQYGVDIWDEIHNDRATLFAEHLTEEELLEWNRFYTTPTGQKVAKIGWQSNGQVIQKTLVKAVDLIKVLVQEHQEKDAEGE